MTQADVRLVSQMIRHQRGIVTAWRKWAHTLDPSAQRRDLMHVLTMQDAVIDQLELWLFSTKVDLDPVTHG